MFKKFNREFLIHNNKDDQYNPAVVYSPFSGSDLSITWSNREIGTTSTRVLLKHYNATSNIDDSITDLAVNGDFATNRMHSRTIYLTNGNQLITWCSDMQDSSGFGVYATILEHSGSIVKEEFLINTHTASNQEFPSVAPLANGGFIIVWHSLGQDTKQITSGVFAKVFNSSGETIKEEFQINDYTANNQDHPVITVLDNGSYVIAWQSFGQDGSGRGVYAKIYDQNHFVVKEEFRVNSYTESNQEFPALAKIADNKFIAVWQSNQQDGSGTGIYAKIFNSDGNIKKEEFRVNSYTEDHQKSPSVTLLSDESFIITWQSQGQDGSGYGIYAKEYTKEAIPLGEEFRVNDYTKNNQESPQITALANGSCAIVWQSFGQDGYKSSVYGQIFTNENNTIYDQITYGSTTSPVEEISTTDAPTTIKPVPVSTVTPVTPVLETNMTKINTTSTPTVVPGHTDITTAVGTTTAPTQISTEGPVITPQPLSTLDSSTVAPQPGSTENTKESSEVPSSTNFVTTDATVNATNVPTPAVTTTTATSTAPLSTNITSILLNTSSTLPINGSEAGNNFIITSNVKEATIIAGSGVDTFIFEPSNNAIVYIDNFGNNDLLNLSNVTNATAYAQLNTTSGSTHFHLPYNQTVVIKNKYPQELNDANFVLQNTIITDHGNITNRSSLGNQVAKDSSSNIEYLIAGVTVGTVALISGAIACTIAGIMIYRHKKAVAAVSAKIAETVAGHLPYGNEEEVNGSGVLSSSSDSSVVDMSGSSNEADLSGTVTIVG